MSHIILSVGHQNCLAAIPVSLVSAISVEDIRAYMPDLLQRLTHMTKSRVHEFQYSVMGNKVKMTDDMPSDVSAVVGTIKDVIEYAEFTKHDHVVFNRSYNLWETVSRNHDDMVTLAYNSLLRNPMSKGLTRSAEQEVSRLARMSERVPTQSHLAFSQW